MGPSLRNTSNGLLSVFLMPQSVDVDDSVDVESSVTPPPSSVEAVLAVMRAFDASTDEAAFWRLPVAGYTSGNLTIDIEWNSWGSQTTGTVVWEAQLAAYTPETDTGAIESKALGTLNYVQDTHLGTTATRLMRCTITLSNLDSLADGDAVWLRIARDATGTNATDSMTGDAGFAGAWVTYS